MSDIRHLLEIMNRLADGFRGRPLGPKEFIQDLEQRTLRRLAPPRPDDRENRWRKKTSTRCRSNHEKQPCAPSPRIGNDVPWFSHDFLRCQQFFRSNCHLPGH